MGTIIGISIGVYDKCLVPVLLEALVMSHPPRVMLDVGITGTRYFGYICRVKKLFTVFKNGKFTRPTDLLEYFPIRKSCSHSLVALMLI